MPDLKRLLLSLRCIGVGFALLGLGAGPAQAEGFAGLEILPEPVMRGDSPALLNAEGTAVPLSGAPVTVLNFWATWCAPCLAELPTLIALDEALSVAERLYAPDAVIYDAGVDVHENDDLGLLNISTPGVYQRDCMVFEWCRRHNLPVACVIGGGYQRDINALVDVQLQMYRAAGVIP